MDTQDSITECVMEQTMRETVFGGRQEYKAGTRMFRRGESWDFWTKEEDSTGDKHYNKLGPIY